MIFAVGASLYMEPYAHVEMARKDIKSIRRSISEVLCTTQSMRFICDQNRALFTQSPWWISHLDPPVSLTRIQHPCTRHLEPQVPTDLGP